MIKTSLSDYDPHYDGPIDSEKERESCDCRLCLTRCLTISPDYNGAGTNPEEVNGDDNDNFDTVNGDERDRAAQWNHYGRQ